MFRRFITLISGKLTFTGTENLFLYLRTTWATQKIEVASGLVLIVSSPEIDGEIIPDGEIYIL